MWAPFFVPCLPAALKLGPFGGPDIWSSCGRDFSILALIARLFSPCLRCSAFGAAGRPRFRDRGAARGTTRGHPILMRRRPPGGPRRRSSGSDVFEHLEAEAAMAVFREMLFSAQRLNSAIPSTVLAPGLSPFKP